MLVLPFAGASEGSSAWIGQAVQQDLCTDLTQGTTARVIAPSQVGPAVDANGALRSAVGTGASIVVFGQAQSSAGDVRLTGQVLDVATGHPLGALKATGAATEMFHLEDALAGQIFATLPRGLLTAQTLQGLRQSQQAADQPTPQAAQTEVPQPTPEPTPAPPPSIEQSVQPPPAGVVPSPAYTDGAEVVTGPIDPYPNYSYDYVEPPVYSYPPLYAYNYVTPGCDIGPDFYRGDFGYGYYRDHFHRGGEYGGDRSGRYREHDFGPSYHRQPEYRDRAGYASRSESGRFGTRSVPDHGQFSAGGYSRSHSSSGSSSRNTSGFGSSQTRSAAPHESGHGSSGGSSHSSGSHGGGRR